MKTCLLSFSGGLDSTASAILLREQGWDVTLGHIEWFIEGMDFGQAQTEAAQNIAQVLDLPLLTLATVRIPLGSYAKYSWVPVCVSTIMHHAGDPCDYPQSLERRYDAVAFGFCVTDYPGYPHGLKRKWLAATAAYTYHGRVLFPVDLLRRPARAALIPPHILDLTVCCYLGESAAEPCGTCWKCRG